MFFLRLSGTVMKFLIADDHALYRKGICDLLCQFNTKKIEIIEAGNWQDAITMVAMYPESELAIVDLNMPGMDAFEGLQVFLDSAEAVPVVVISSSLSQFDMKRALDAGAMGYIVKNESTAVMTGALRLVLAGGIYVPPQLLQTSSPEIPLRQHALPYGLTPRQYEVLQLVTQDKSNKAIASELNMSDRTVKAHIGAILKVLGVSNRQQAIKAINTENK